MPSIVDAIKIPNCYNFVMEEKYIKSLLSHYDKNRRLLPWREDATPYHVYISEIMLQQTRIEAVKGYYLRFIFRYPDVNAVAKAPLEELETLWQGLGYYSRIRNIQKSCIEIKEKYDSVIPSDLDKLHCLPGIGDYTAKAILAIGYQKNYIAVDGNLLRIYSRLTMSKGGIKNKKTKEKAESYFLSDTIKRPGDYLQALMDLGEMICLPNGRPLCEECPFSSFCMAHLSHEEMDYPIKNVKKEKKEEEKTVLLLVYQDEVLIHKRDKNGLLSSLYEFMTIDGKMNIEEVERYLNKNQIHTESITKLEERRFVFTHRVWKLSGYLVVLKKKIEGLFALIENLSDYAIPSAFSYYKELLQKKK